MLLLNIDMKACISSPMTLSHLILSDLQRSISRSVRYQILISRKAAELGQMLLHILSANMKSYMGSPKPPSHLQSNELTS